MPGSTEDPAWAVFLTCVISHIPMIPTLVLLYRRRLAYECLNGLYAVLVSFMYHASDIYNARVFLRPLQWHRLDNIGAITSLGVTFMHLACFESQDTTDYLKFSFVFVVSVLQEGYPWDERFTIVPVVVGALVPVVSHLRHPQRRRGLITFRLAVSVIIYVLAGVFFAIGLDDRNDPFRMFHGLFHCSVACAMFIMWTGIRPVRRDASKREPPPLRPRDGDNADLASYV